MTVIVLPPNARAIGLKWLGGLQLPLDSGKASALPEHLPNRDRERKTDKETETETEKETDRQTDRQTDR